MKKFKVRLQACAIYRTTVEAKTPEEAEQLALGEAGDRVTVDAWEVTDCEDVTDCEWIVSDEKI